MYIPCTEPHIAALLHRAALRALRFTSWRNGGGFHPGYRGGLLRGLLHDGSVVSASRRNPRDVLGKHRSM